MSLTRDKLIQSKLELMGLFSCDNVHNLPKLTKVVLSCGLNSARVDSATAKLVQTDVGLIAGLRPARIFAKKSVAGFKIREGQLIALKTTLRSVRMFEFLDRLIHIALPKLREFRGLSVSAFDKHNNISFGIKQYSIFPEIKYNKNTRLLGINVTLCVRADSRIHAIRLLTFLGIPFIAIV
ncbi:MAG: 50S ribosomal protein L5 [Candidatus Hodgkinia cicadicola]|nr:MAG: 50S ribosomal protein L5 [Candidatus Hodgkinia cicadicola]